MTLAARDHEPKVRQGDLWAWTVSFVVALGLHVGIVLFTTLSIILGIYALASALVDISWGVRAVAWVFTVVSLTLWGWLIKQQARGFRPHEIRGLGKVAIDTSGCERGEIAADIGAVLIGLAQTGPLLVSLITGDSMPERTQVVTVLVGGLFVTVGGGALILRLWVRRQRTEATNGEQV
jgi:hypothetical protein